MQIMNSKYHKCWEVEVKDKFTKVRFGDSRKNKDGVYENCTWNGILVGKAHAEGLNKDDKFDILSGQVFSTKGKDDKWYTNVTIFEIQVTQRAEFKAEEIGAVSSIDEEDGDVPF